MTVDHDDGAWLEEQIATAFARAATVIDVAPLPFDAGDTPAPVGRGVRLSPPKPSGADRRPSSEVDALSPSNGSRRGHRLMAAVAAAIVLATGAVAFRHAGGSEAGSGPGSGRSSLRTVERRAETIDPMLLDYVFPVNGDDWAAALDRFDISAASAEWSAIKECVRLRGYPGAESWIVSDAMDVARKLLQEWLPSLRRISGNEVLATPGLPPSSEQVAAKGCAEENDIPWDRWRIDAAELRSLEHLRPAMERVQETRLWTESRACLVEAGFPPDPSMARKALPDQLVDEYGPLQVRPPLEVFVYLASITPSLDIADFVRCTTPFFDEVERVLQGPRAEFVKEHRAELLELQRRFEAFAGPGD